MTKREKIIEALKLAEEVQPKGQVWGGHDVFSVADPDAKFSEEQKQRLASLGFLCNSDYGWYCFT